MAEIRTYDPGPGNRTGDLLPPLLRDARGAAFGAAADAALDLNPWLACPLKVCEASDDEEVLWELARQFDVGGGLMQAMRTRKQRERLIRGALKLQMKRGTPWAVAEIMRLLGYTDADTIDRVGGLLYDATAIHDGEFRHESGVDEWNDYRIRLFIDRDSRGFTAADRVEAAALAENWAPLRSNLTGFTVRHVLTTAVDDPYLEVGRALRLALIDGRGDRQTVERMWKQYPAAGLAAVQRILPEGSAAIQWRLAPGEMGLADVAAVAATGTSGEDIHVQRPPAVGTGHIDDAPDVTYEGVWTFIRRGTA